jgi:hypothetical protein
MPRVRGIATTVAQRARGAYIATVSQLEATFYLSDAAQVINPKVDVKRLNKRLQSQLDHLTRGLQFVRLNYHLSEIDGFRRCLLRKRRQFTLPNRLRHMPDR